MICYVIVCCFLSWAGRWLIKSGRSTSRPPNELFGLLLKHILQISIIFCGRVFCKGLQQGESSYTLLIQDQIPKLGKHNPKPQVTASVFDFLEQIFLSINSPYSNSETDCLLALRINPEISGDIRPPLLYQNITLTWPRSHKTICSSSIKIYLMLGYYILQ